MLTPNEMGSTLLCFGDIKRLTISWQFTHQSVVEGLNLLIRSPYTKYQGNIPSRFTRNSEADASE